MTGANLITSGRVPKKNNILFFIKLTRFFTVYFLLLYNKKMEKNYKSGFVSIIGRPNVGKSTLLNQILEQKIVIATDKAQTTRKRIKGIYTDKEGQIVFVDTPGMHKPLNKLGEFLLDEAKISVPDSDLVLFLVDGSTEAGKGDKWIVENVIKQSKSTTILIINKVDKVGNQEKLSNNIKTYLDMFDNKIEVIKISARTGKNKKNLVEKIFNQLPEGELLYHDDVVTEEKKRDIAEEIVREKILLNTKDEIPHSVAIKIENYEEKEDIDKIYATIMCEHKRSEEHTS